MRKMNQELETLGQKFSRVRRERSIDIRTISDRLKIKEQFVIAIEEDNFENFSSDTHIKGFIRNIAKELGIDPQIAIKIYNRDNRTNTKACNPKQIDRPDSSKGMYSPFKGLLLGLFLTFWLILFIIVFNQITSSSRPELTITFPVYIDAQETDRYILDWERDEIVLRGDIQAGNSLRVNNMAIDTYGMDKFETASFPLEDGENTLTIETRNQYGVKNTLTIQIFR
jgi:hypothetical protein